MKPWGPWESVGIYECRENRPRVVEGSNNVRPGDVGPVGENSYTGENLRADSCDGLKRHGTVVARAWPPGGTSVQTQGYTELQLELVLLRQDNDPSVIGKLDRVFVTTLSHHFAAGGGFACGYAFGYGCACACAFGLGFGLGFGFGFGFPLCVPRLASNVQSCLPIGP